MRKPWAEAEDDRALAMRLNYSTGREIAEDLGRTKSGVEQRMMTLKVFLCKTIKQAKDVVRAA